MCQLVGHLLLHLTTTVYDDTANTRDWLPLRSGPLSPWDKAPPGEWQACVREWKARIPCSAERTDPAAANTSSNPRSNPFVASLDDLSRVTLFELHPERLDAVALYAGDEWLLNIQEMEKMHAYSGAICHWLVAILEEWKMLQAADENARRLLTARHELNALGRRRHHARTKEGNE